MLMQQVPKPEKVDKFTLYLSVTDRSTSQFFGQFYKCTSGKNSFLSLPKEGADLINEYLENVFRSSMIYFIEGHIAENEDGQIRKAIDMFLVKYELYEHGFETESLRRYYYRIMENGYFLKKNQHDDAIKFKKTERKKFTAHIPKPVMTPQLSLF